MRVSGLLGVLVWRYDEQRAHSLAGKVYGAVVVAVVAVSVVSYLYVSDTSLNQEMGRKEGMVSARAFVMGHFINDDARALIRSFLAASATVCAAAKRSLGLEATQVMPSLLASCLSSCATLNRSSGK